MAKYNSPDVLSRSSHSNAAKLIGTRFTRLIVVARSSKESPTNPRWKSKGAFWVCHCDCGNVTIASTANLRNGHVKSCGCYQRERTSETRKAEAQQRFGLSARKRAYAVYVRNARYRNYEFEISLEQFLELSQKECYYCGAGPSNISRNQSNNGDYIYNGLDRMDNSKGYLIDNVVPCCFTCNIAKAGKSISDFLAWIHRTAAKHPL